MGRFAGLLALMVLLSACGVGASPGSIAGRSQSPSPEPAVTATPSPTESPVQASQQPAASSSPAPVPSPPAEVMCRQYSGAKNIVLLGSQYAPNLPSLIYEVSDPLHPRLLCRVLRTSAHLSISAYNFSYLDPRSATQTNEVARWYDGRETPGIQIPAWTTSAAWLPSGTLVAYTVRVEPTGSDPGGAVQVWVYEQGSFSLLFTYRLGIGGCPCRFGIPPPVLAVSPDGQYLVAGQLTGKGSEPLALYRVSDRARLLTLDPDVGGAFWDRYDDRLFLAGGAITRMWTPAEGLTDISGAGRWSFFPGLSPDGTKVAYTAYSDPVQMTQPRSYIHDLSAGTTQVLGDKLRTQVLFVKDGWVWYLEEVPAGAELTKPTGKVFAVQLSTGIESPVVFAPGEDWQTQSAQTWATFTPGGLWPVIQAPA